MEHPIRAEYHKGKRKALTELIKSRYDLVRQDTVVFVCGGNEAHHARTRFLAIAATELPDYDLFTPESALSKNWQSEDGPFELTQFEELIAEISLAIVIFPESPGSFCETGYFTAKDNICRKTLLAIDLKFQINDSFISTGPVHRLNERSDFRPTQYIDYEGTFEEVISRIKSRKPEKHRKTIVVEKYSQLLLVEKLGLIQKIVVLLRIATAADVIFIFRSAFRAQISEREIRGLIAILRGSQYLLIVEPYGHLRANPKKGEFLEIRSGHKAHETAFLLDIALLIDESSEFLGILLGEKNAA